MQSSLSWLRNCLIIAVARIPAGYEVMASSVCLRLVKWSHYLFSGWRDGPVLGWAHWRRRGSGHRHHRRGSFSPAPSLLPHTAMTSSSPLLSSALLLALLAGSLVKYVQPEAKTMWSLKKGFSKLYEIFMYPHPHVVTEHLMFGLQNMDDKNELKNAPYYSRFEPLLRVAPV